MLPGKLDRRLAAALERQIGELAAVGLVDEFVQRLIGKVPAAAPAS